MKKTPADIKRYEIQAQIYEKDATKSLNAGKINEEIPELYETAASNWKEAEHPVNAWADLVAAERLYQDLGGKYKGASGLSREFYKRAEQAKKHAHKLGQEMHASWLFDILSRFIKIPRPVRVTAGIISICIGTLLVSSTITGNAVSNVSTKSSGIIGVIILIIGIIIAYLGSTKKFNKV